MIERNWQELIRPEKPQIETGSDAQRKARLVAEPLERGFGVTLGNALRRVLLSSLQGAAVTAIQIDGVVHEFSSLEGVREDVVDIVLNIKTMGLRLHGDGPKRMRLRADGPGEVTAGMIETGPDIEVMDPELVICTLDNSARLVMELTVENGKGYVPASQNRPEDAPIGLIPVDAQPYDLQFFPHPPSADAIAADPQVLAVADALITGGPRDVIAISAGHQNGVDNGTVFSVWREGPHVVDRVRHPNTSRITDSPNAGSRRDRMPDEYAAHAMVFLTFDFVSYALVMEGTKPVQTGYRLKHPDAPY